jgi:hypothetical protein
MMATWDRNKWSVGISQERFQEIAMRALRDDERFKPGPEPKKRAWTHPGIRPFKIGERKFNTIEQACEFFKCSTATVHRALKQGLFPIRVMVPVQHLEAT